MAKGSSVPPAYSAKRVDGRRAYELARVAEQVEATSQAVHAVMTYPDERIKALTGPKASKQPFAALRRIGR